MATSDSLVASIAARYHYNFQFTYTMFNQMCDDVDDARVYGGIHFRFDQVAGTRLGRDIATYLYKHNLRKATGTE